MTEGFWAMLAIVVPVVVVQVFNYLTVRHHAKKIEHSHAEIKTEVAKVSATVDKNMQVITQSFQAVAPGKATPPAEPDTK